MVAIYAMLIKLALEKKSHLPTVLIGVLSGFIMLSVPISYSEGIKAGKETKVSREREAFVLYTYESQPDELLMKHLCPDDAWCVVHPFGRADIREQAGTLKRLNYNVFSESPARVVPPSPSGLSLIAHPADTNATRQI